LGIEPHYREWDGSGSLVSFVVSLNLHRRHLTSSQRAAIALDIEAQLAVEAKEQQGRRTDIFVGLQKSYEPIHAAERAAEIMGTSQKYVSDAKNIATQAPDLLEQVKAGEMTIPSAKRELAARERKDSPPLPSDKFRVIYADPPWKYTDKIDEAISGTTTALTHYPAMTIDELCQMPINELAEDDSILFMWVTSPMLEDAFRVVHSWKFKYKTSFVWDKVSHNFGHYNSVRHEFLFVCTRGSCTPDNPKLYDSVQSIEKSRVHSEKPEEFRAIIDDLYTYGKRIELFARQKVEGWEYYGNELR